MNVVNDRSYLAEPNGVVVGLRPRVEVHGLLDVVVALVVPGQVVGRRPVTSVVGDLRRLASRKQTIPLTTTTTGNQ